MKCWHCDSELEIDFQSQDLVVRFYHCSVCDKWYEMKKEKSRLNGAVPVRFSELEVPPRMPAHL